MKAKKREGMEEREGGRLGALGRKKRRKGRREGERLEARGWMKVREMKGGRAIS